MRKSFLTKSILGWSFFDFANSSYTTVIITSVYNRYFVNVVACGMLSYEADSLWLMTLSMSYLLVSFISPLWGVLSDVSHNKKGYLFLSYIFCVVPTFLLFFTGECDIAFAMVLIIVSNISFSLSENVISSFLPDLASRGSMGKVSGFAWGFGYLGGILSLLGAMFIISSIDGNYGVRLSFLFTALFFAISGIPTFLWLKEKKREKEGGRNSNAIVSGRSFSAMFSLSYKRLFFTLKKLSYFSELVKLLCSYFLYYAGLMTIIAYSAIYADRVFHFDDVDILLLIVAVNIASAIGAFLFGFVQDSFGAKRTLVLILIFWILLFVVIFYTNERWLFWIMAIFLGIGIGGVQSTTRALVGIFSPSSHSGEFYGLWGFFGKLSAIVGLYSFALVLEWFRSERYAILFSMLCFVLALLVLFFVKESKGISQGSSVDYKETI